jgi:hypothetical protein
MTLALQNSPRIPQLVIVVLFILGWLHNSQSLWDVGDRSITLLMIASCVLAYFVRQKVLVKMWPMACSVCLGAIVAIPIWEDSRTVSNCLQNVLGIIVASGAAALDWRSIFGRVRTAMMLLAIPLVLYGIYQLFARLLGLPYGWLPVTNLQQYEASGFQRNYLDETHIRASSVFVEGSDFAYFGLWIIAFGLSASSVKGRWLGTVLGFSIVGLSQSLGGLLGAGLMLIVLTVVTRRWGPFIRVVAICFSLLILGGPFFPQQTEKFLARVEAAFSLDEAADSDRVAKLPANLETWSRAPIFGHGIGSWRSAEATQGISSGWMMLLIERGIVGSSLYLVPFVVGLKYAWRKRGLCNEWETFRLLISVNCIFTFNTFAMIYFPPFWFALGVSLSAWSSARSYVSGDGRAVFVNPPSSDQRGMVGVMPARASVTTVVGSIV